MRVPVRLNEPKALRASQLCQRPTRQASCLCQIALATLVVDAELLASLEAAL